MIVVRIVIDNELFIENDGVFVCPKKSLCQLNDLYHQILHCPICTPCTCTTLQISLVITVLHSM